MTIESPGAQPKLASIQYLRAVAALGVVAFHASIAAGAAFPLGAYGVDIFFVISGFVMVWITGEPSRPGAFLLGRVRRIVPVYWVATLAYIAVTTIRLGYFPFGLGGLGSSFLFLPYGPPGEGRHYLPILRVGWTLNYEMMFYLLFAGTLLLRRPVQLIALSSVFAGFVAAGYLFRPSSAPFEFWCDPLILHFLAGAWLAAAVKAGGEGVPRWFALCVLAGLFLLLPLLRLALLLVAAGVLLDLKARVPRSRPLLLLGDASYSIYLWHLLAIAAVRGTVGYFAAPPFLILPAGIVASLLAGLAAYKLIEQPLLRAVGARTQSGSGAASPAIAETPSAPPGSVPADRT